MPLSNPLIAPMLTFCRRDAAARGNTDAHGQARNGMTLCVLLEVNRLSSGLARGAGGGDGAA